MKVLVTGGAGFIGYHLVKRLLDRNINVVVVDNFTLGKKEHVEEFKNNKNYSFYEIDINNTEDFCNRLKNENFDLIYHLAANSDIQKGGKNPNVDFRDTFMTTFSVLEYMRSKDIKRLFFSSTSAIYGDKKESLVETIGDIKPISYYGASKYAGENFISAYTFMNDLETIVFRFPNVIGPNLTHGVIYDFSKKLEINSKELTILGDGSQSKQYIYVSDLIDAIVLLTLDKKTEMGLEIYNVGVETATSVTRIAEIVCEELEYKNVKFNYTGGKIGWKGDIPKFRFDLSKIKKTGWSPKYSSEEAVRETIKNIKEK